MSVLVLVTLAALAVLNYRVCRDFRYPPVLMSLIWLIAMTVYYLSPLEIDSIGLLTALIFLSALIAFSGGAYFALDLFGRGDRPGFPHLASLASPSAHPQLKIIFLVLSVALLPLIVQKALQLAAQSSSDVFFSALRGELLAGDSKGYGRLSYAPLLSYFTTFVYAIESRSSRGERLQYCLSLAASFAYAVLSTGRTYLFLILAVLAGVFLMQGRFRFRTFIVSALVFLLSFAFLGIAMSKGGSPDASWTDNVSSIGESLLIYAEGPIPAFDKVVRKDAPLEYGENTFIGPLNLLRRLAGKSYLSAIQEEVNVPFPINVYTGVHPVYKDFGIVGVILAFAIIGAAWTYSYSKSLAGDRLHIFYYALALFPLLFMTFSDQCFAPMMTWIMFGSAAYFYFRTGKGCQQPLSI